MSTGAKISDLFLQAQRVGVKVDRPDEAFAYLLRFPDMIEVVERAVLAARNHLNEAQLQLEVYRDPEAEDEHLVIYARFPEYNGTEIERIRAAKKEFLHMLHGRSGWLSLTTDFKWPA